MHNRKSFVSGEVRVGILPTDHSVSGPTRMGNAKTPAELGETFPLINLFHPPGVLASLDLARVQ